MGNKADNGNDFDTSWIPVFIMLFIFWPVGLFMLVKKLHKLSESGKKRRRGPFSGVGVALMGVGFIQMLRLFGAGSLSGLVGGLLTLIGGLAVVRYGLGGKGQDARQDDARQDDDRRAAQGPGKWDEKLLERYMKIIGQRRTVPIEELAKKTSSSYNDVYVNLKRLIDMGGFGPDAYIDIRARKLVLFDIAEEIIIDENVAAESAPAKEPAAEAQPAPEPVLTTEQQLERDFQHYIEQIRSANEAIQHERISSQIDYIEDITVSIFRLVKEQPEKRNQIHTFMNYYLPTTLKLLKNYSQLERQKVSGTNIKTSMENIEKMMDQLVFAFEQQLDNLFESDALDISSDIKVLERMMAKDGLSENNYTFPTKKSAPGGAAAQAQQRPE